MYRMYGMPRAQGCAGAAMYRMYGQKTAPAFSALPPSLAVVCRGRRALESFLTVPAFPPSMEVMRRSGDVQDVRADVLLGSGVT